MKQVSSDMRVTHAVARKQYDKALQLLRETERDEPGVVENRFLIPCVYRWKGDNASSMKSALETLESHPNHFLTLRLLTELTFENHQYEDSREFAKRALACYQTGDADVLPRPFLWILGAVYQLPLPRGVKQQIRALRGHVQEEKRWLEWATNLVDSD